MKVAVIQAKPVSKTPDIFRGGGDVGHALDLLSQAAELGADIACFPQRYPFRGEDELKKKSAELGIWTIAGLAHEVSGGYESTATFISSDGTVVGRQAKLFPTVRERADGCVAGDRITAIETPWGRLGAVVCGDLAYYGRLGDQIREQRIQAVFNPAFWYAMAAAYPSTIIARHLEWGVPVIGVDMAASPSLIEQNGKLVELFSRGGGYSTVASQPPVQSFTEFTEWLNRQPGGANGMDGIAKILGEDEEVVAVDIDLEATSAFPGYYPV